MKQFGSVLVAGCVLLAVNAAQRVEAAGIRLAPGLPASAVLLLRYDANHDGIITREEMEAGLKADFAAADTNGDGCLNSAEVRVENALRLKRDGSQASPLVDWNLDGCVDMKEFSNTVHSYFQLADRTKDGRVSQLELRGPSMPMSPPVNTPAARNMSQAGQQSTTGSMAGQPAPASHY